MKKKKEFKNSDLAEPIEIEGKNLRSVVSEIITWLPQFILCECSSIAALSCLKYNLSYFVCDTVNFGNLSVSYG